MNNFMRLTRLTGLLTMSFLSFAAIADGMTDEARGLIEAGKGAKAYSLLEPMERERAGDPLYDLLLGISALDAGQGTRAIFALERVLAMEPNNARARAELGRAYAAVGETEAAKAELHTTRSLGVPLDVAETIDKLISAIDVSGEANRTTVRGYVEATVGYDTNINAAPNQSTVAIPAFGGLPFELSANSHSREDTFGAFGAGVSVRHPLNKALAVVGGLNGNQRWNSESGRFNTGNVDTNLGLAYAQGDDSLLLTGQYSTLSLDANEYRAAAGGTALWQHNLDARNQFSAFVQYSHLRYPEQSVRDADRTVLGGAYAHVYRSGGVIFLSAYGAHEKEQQAGVPWLGHDAYGFRAGGQWILARDIQLFGSLAYEHRRYGGIDPSFLTRRIDNQYIFNLGVNYALAKNWALTPQFTLTDNQSNAGLNDYHREMVSVTIRRDF